MMTNLQQCICFCCFKSENPDNIEIVRVIWLHCGVETATITSCLARSAVSH